jgi:tRNA(Ile)-lysidine synthase
MRQYAEGRKFVHGVVERVGMAGFNRIFSSPLTLPRSTSSVTRTPGWPGCTGRSRPSVAGREWPGSRRRSRPSAGGAPLVPAAAGALVLVACSGGADSMALAAATALVVPGSPGAGWSPWITACRTAPRTGRARGRVGPAAGFDPVEVATVECPGGRRARGGRAHRPVRAPHRGRRATRAPPCCSGTPGTTRPRPYCWRWPGAPGRGGWPDAVPQGPLLRPLLDVTAPTPARRARRWAGGVDGPAQQRPGVRALAGAGGALPALIAALGPAVVANLAVRPGSSPRTRRAGRLAPPRWPAPGERRRACRRGAGRLPDAVRTRVLHAWARSWGARRRPLAPARRGAGRAGQRLARPGTDRAARGDPGRPPGRVDSSGWIPVSSLSLASVSGIDGQAAKGQPQLQIARKDGGPGERRATLRCGRLGHG